MFLLQPLSVWDNSHMYVMHPTIFAFRDSRVFRARLAHMLLLFLLISLFVVSYVPYVYYTPQHYKFPHAACEGPILIRKPTFMSSMPTVCNASPYFFYLTCEFSLHCARHVLVHALLPIYLFVGTAFSCCAA